MMWNAHNLRVARPHAANCLTLNVRFDKWLLGAAKRNTR